jgi:hypothetical protein
MSSYADAPDMRCKTYAVIAGSAFEYDEARRLVRAGPRTSRYSSPVATGKV